MERSLDDTGQGLATPITPVEASGVRDTQRPPNPENRSGVNDNTIMTPKPGHKRGSPEPGSNAVHNKRTKSLPDEVELTRMMNDAGAVNSDATIHGTESESGYLRKFDGQKLDSSHSRNGPLHAQRFFTVPIYDVIV